MLDRLINQINNLILIASPKRPTVDVLFLTDAEFQDPPFFNFTVALATDTYKLSAEDVHFVKSWKEAVKIIQGFATIKRLVMFFHGGGGQIQIFSLVLGVDTQMSVPSQQWPAIDEVIFEGCELARKGEPTLVFTRNLKTKKLVAWNFYHIAGGERFPPGVELKTVEDRLKVYAQYVLRGTPDAARIKKEADALGGMKEKAKRARFVGREWLREDQNDAPLPKNPFDSILSKYCKLSDAVANQVVIKTDGEAEDLTDEQATTSGLKPRRVVFEPAP